MTRLGIIDRLQAGDVLVMDGATGSELQRRGVDVNKGSVEGKIGVWSAAANLDAPEVVRAIHEDYLDADLYVARVECRGVAINGADWFYIGNPATNCKVNGVCWTKTRCRSS